MNSPRTRRVIEREGGSRQKGRLIKKPPRQTEYTPPTSPHIKPENLPLPVSVPPSPALSARQAPHSSPSPSVVSVTSRQSDQGSVVSSSQQPTVEDYQSDTEKSPSSALAETSTEIPPEKGPEPGLVEDKCEAPNLAEDRKDKSKAIIAADESSDAVKTAGESEPLPEAGEDQPVAAGESGKADEDPNTLINPDTETENGSQSDGKANQATADQPVVERSTTDQTIVNQPPTDQPTTDQVPTDQAQDKQPRAEQSSVAPSVSTPALRSPTTASVRTNAARNSPSLSQIGPRTETPTPRSPTLASYPQSRGPYYPPFADPYSSPPMPGYQPNYFYPNMPSYAVAPPHGTLPYAPSYGGFGSPYGSYGSSPTVQRHNSVGSRSSNAGDPGARPTDSAVEDDPSDLLSRISSAIPDLNLLLSRYNETRCQLGVREELIRKAEATQADALKRKEDYIDNLTKQLENAAKQHSAESNKLRLQIGDLEEKKTQLEENIAEAEASKKALGEARASLEKQKANVETEKQELEKSTVEEKERLLKEFEEWKEKANEAFNSEKMALAVEFDRLEKEKQDANEREKAQMIEDHIKEKETLRTEFQRQKRELEASFDKVRKELESKLSGVQKDFEEALKKERESREVWNAERETLTKGWEDERETLRKGWDEQRELLTSQFNKEKEDLRKEWDARQVESEKKTQGEKDTMTQEKEKMKKEWDEDKASLEKVVGELKSIAGNFGAEKERMQKIIEGFGEVPDLKGKGDVHYRDAFSRLQKQIFTISTTYYKDLPSRSPEVAQDQLPPNLPLFLDTSPSAYHIRTSYIMHKISLILTTRIFSPFLFSLNGDETTTNELLQETSTQLRQKSPLKEAAWRRQTLTTLFTGPDAKRRINAVAGKIVDEIFNAIKIFANPRHEEAIRIEVRRIVKLAAETWRFARLERETISANMPAMNTTSDEDKQAEFWPAPSLDVLDYPVSSIAGLEEKHTSKSNVLLRMFPIISREPLLKGSRVPEHYGKEDTGCVYSYGLALYEDSPTVLSRLRELRFPESSSPPPPLEEKAAPQPEEPPGNAASTPQNDRDSQAESEPKDNLADKEKPGSKIETPEIQESGTEEVPSETADSGSKDGTVGTEDETKVHPVPQDAPVRDEVSAVKENSLADNADLMGTTKDERKGSAADSSETSQAAPTPTEEQIPVRKSASQDEKASEDRAPCGETGRERTAEEETPGEIPGYISLPRSYDTRTEREVTKKNGLEKVVTEGDPPEEIPAEEQPLENNYTEGKAADGNVPDDEKPKEAIYEENLEEKDAGGITSDEKFGPANAAKRIVEGDPAEEKLTGEMVVDKGLPEEAKSSQDTAAEDKPAEDTIAEEKPATDKHTDDKAAQETAAEHKFTEDKPADERSDEDKPTEHTSAEEAPAEDKLMEEKASEDQVIEEKAADEQPAGKPSEVIASEGKADEETAPEGKFAQEPIEEQTGYISLPRKYGVTPVPISSSLSMKSGHSKSRSPTRPNSRGQRFKGEDIKDVPAKSESNKQRGSTAGSRSSSRRRASKGGNAKDELIATEAPDSSQTESSNCRGITPRSRSSSKARSKPGNVRGDESATSKSTDPPKPVEAAEKGPEAEQYARYHMHDAPVGHNLPTLHRTSSPKAQSRTTSERASHHPHRRASAYASSAELPSEELPRGTSSVRTSSRPTAASFDSFERGSNKSYGTTSSRGTVSDNRSAAIKGLYQHQH